jgi:DNA repair protein RecO (recombination protein O)
MPSEKTVALVLRTAEFSETSLIVTCFSRDFGKLGCLAKGGRRLKSSFDSALDLLTLCRIVFLHKTSESLDLVTEAKLVRHFRPKGKNLSSLYAGYYLAELLDALTDRNDPHPGLFDLACSTLAELADSSDPGETARRVIHFELVLLGELGLLPALDRCADCGKRLVRPQRVAFGLNDGGVLCTVCRGGRSNIVSVSARGIETLQVMSDQENVDRWRDFDWDQKVRRELRRLLNHYFNHLLGRKPRLQSYLD